MSHSHSNFPAASSDKSDDGSHRSLWRDDTIPDQTSSNLVICS